MKELGEEICKWVEEVTGFKCKFDVSEYIHPNTGLNYMEFYMNNKTVFGSASGNAEEIKRFFVYKFNELLKKEYREPINPAGSVREGFLDFADWVGENAQKNFNGSWDTITGDYGIPTEILYMQYRTIMSLKKKDPLAVIVK